jgi:hypothetical protein
MKNVSDRIVEIARACLGQHETTGNAGFVNPAFEKRMKSVGFEPGMAWCALFAELCWTEAFAELHPELLPEIAARFTPAAVPTLNSFRLSRLFMVGTVPKPGAVVIWRHSTSGWQGHAGIVVSAEKDVFVTIEGNTNAAGGREGIEVALKTRQLDWRKLPNRLNLAGFIYPSRDFTAA